MSDDAAKKNTPIRKKVGFGKFVYMNLGKNGFYAGVTRYEIALRKKITSLKEQKKNVTCIEKIKTIDKSISSIKSKLLNATDTAILNYLMTCIKSDNLVDLNKVKKTQGGIARELYLERTSVSKSFNKLKKLHVINYKTEGNAFSKIEISPYVCWQGEASKHAYRIAIMRDSFYCEPFEFELGGIYEDLLK